MERRKGKRQQQQKEKHGLPLVAGDDPVEYEDDRDAVVVANSARVKGSGVGHDSSSSGDEAAELRSEDSDSDSEEDYVAYGRLDVETATEAVTEWLRQRLAPPAAAAAPEEEEERANTKGGRRKALSSPSSSSPLPATRREWSRQADIVRLCRVERQVEGLAVVGLLHQAHLIRLVPPPDTGSGGSKGKGATGSSSSKAAPRGKRKPKTAAAAADDESEEVEEEEEEEGGVAEVVRGLGAEAAGQVGVEWVAQLQDMARLEEALTQQLGDGSVILARVLPWVRTRLAPGANDGGGGGKKKGGRVSGGGGGGKQQQQGALPSTLEELLAAIEQEQWGAITHRVRPNDVVPTPAAAIHTRHTHTTHTRRVSFGG
jgi:hypothetical protein